MLMEISSVQLENAKSLILVTELGMVVFLQPEIKVFVVVSMMALQLLRESYVVFPVSTLIDASPEQPKNAPLPILFTELGM
jgi:hypothetical protein